jgi:hypothetical protein
MSFAERIGGVLVAPRRTFARLVAGEARAGDVVVLVAAWLIAGDLTRLVRAVLLARAVGIDAGVQGLLVVVGGLLPSVLAILVAGMMFSLFLPRRSPVRARALDVAAYAWIPYLTLMLAAMLALFVRGRALSATAEAIVQGVGIAWSVVIWAIALAEAYARPPSVTKLPTAQEGT